MANELQTKLDAILLDKNTNLLPENIKKGITVLGITGTAQTTSNTLIQFDRIPRMLNEEGAITVDYDNPVGLIPVVEDMFSVNEPVLGNTGYQLWINASCRIVVVKPNEFIKAYIPDSIEYITFNYNIDNNTVEISRGYATNNITEFTLQDEDGNNVYFDIPSKVSSSYIETIKNYKWKITFKEWSTDKEEGTSTITKFTYSMDDCIIFSTETFNNANEDFTDFKDSLQSNSRHVGNKYQYQEGADYRNLSSGAAKIYNANTFNNVALANSILDDTNNVLKLKITILSRGIYERDSGLQISFANLANKIGLTADKIKKGETILGITGTYEPDYVELGTISPTEYDTAVTTSEDIRGTTTE